MATTHDYSALPPASSLENYAATPEWKQRDDEDEDEGCFADSSLRKIHVLRRVALSQTQTQEEPEIWSIPVSSHNPKLACYHEISDEIRRAASERERHSALDHLTFIWNRLEALTTETEAKFRLRLEPQRLHGPTPPEWLKRAIDDLQKSGVEKHLVATAGWLITAVLDSLGYPQDLRASVSKTPSGLIEVEWDGRAELRWLIAPVMLPFPGVNVRTFVSKDGSLGLHAETFRLASKVVEHARKALS